MTSCFLSCFVLVFFWTILFLLCNRIVAERQFLHAVFPFHFPDKTISLQRKSNLILNIFSMKAIRSINSPQKEWNAVGYSKGESPWKLFSWDSELSRLQAWLSEERRVSWREKQYLALSVVTTNAAEGLPWIIDCVHRGGYELELLNCCLVNECVRTQWKRVPRCSSLLPVKIPLSDQRAILRSKVWREAPGIRVMKASQEWQLKQEAAGTPGYTCLCVPFHDDYGFGIFAEILNT